MEKLFERHDEYVSTVPMEYVRSMMDKIDWSLRLIAIKGPKGVGKSTLMLQYIRRNFAPDDRHVLYCSADTSYFSNHTLVDVADNFCKQGGTHLFIDEIHKYENWSGEIKEIYDLHRDLHIVVSGSNQRWSIRFVAKNQGICNAGAFVPRIPLVRARTEDRFAFA